MPGFRDSRGLKPKSESFAAKHLLVVSPRLKGWKKNMTTTGLVGIWGVALRFRVKGVGFRICPKFGIPFGMP